MEAVRSRAGHPSAHYTVSIRAVLSAVGSEKWLAPGKPEGARRLLRRG